MLDFLSLLAVLLSVVPVTLLVATVLHESAHAIVALLVGFRVREIHIGRGAPIFATWFGSTLFVVGGELAGGWIQVDYRKVRWFRLRALAVYVVGPLVDVMLLVAVLVAMQAVGLRGWFATVGLLAVTPLTAGTCFSLAPLIGRGQPGSDLAQAAALRRMSLEQVDQLVAQSELQNLERGLARLRDFGKSSEVVSEVDCLHGAEEGAAAGMWHARAVANIALGQLDDALHDVQRGFEHTERDVDRLAADGGDKRMIAWWRRQNRDSFLVNRACIMALMPDGEGVSEAVSELPTVKRGRSKSQEEQAALCRAHATAALRSGDGQKARRILEEVWAVEEPYWLRAVTLGLLARACRLEGEKRWERIWSRRSRRLSTKNPILRAVDQALKADTRAPAAATS